MRRCEATTLPPSNQHMHHLFIDANLYLGFYRLPKDDIDELAKLEALIQKGEVVLFATRLLQDEVSRNREPQLADTLARMRELRPGESYPQVLRNQREFGALTEERRAYVDRLTQLENAVREQASTRSLPADVLIAHLFEAATLLPADDDLIARAIRRSQLGNPPGKPGSVGDAINWEALLHGAGPGTDLHLVTSDHDYSSPLDRRILSRFLVDEWRATVRGSVQLHGTLGDFLKAAGLEINLQEEAERQAAVSELVESGSFSATHRAVRKLERYEAFTVAEVEDMVDAFFSNSQIMQLAGDQDVQDFFGFLIESYDHVLDPETAHDMSGHLGFLDPDF